MRREKLREKQVKFMDKRMNEQIKPRKNPIFAEQGGGAPMELRPERSGGLSGYTVLSRPGEGVTTVTDEGMHRRCLGSPSGRAVSVAD